MGLMHEVHQMGGCMTMELSQLWNGEKKKKNQRRVPLKKRYTIPFLLITSVAWCE